MPAQLTVRIPEELAVKLERAARRARKKRSELVRLALEQFLSGSAARRFVYGRPSSCGTSWERSRRACRTWGSVSANTC